MSCTESTCHSRQLFPTGEMSKFHLNTNSDEVAHTSSTGGQRNWDGWPLALVKYWTVAVHSDCTSITVWQYY